MGKRTRQAKRRAALDNARVEWRDHEYGISLETIRLGHGERARLRWLLDPDPMVVLLSLGAMRKVLHEVEGQYVRACRQDGASWEELGWALGVTGEAVRRRHVSSTLVGSGRGAPSPLSSDDAGPGAA